MNQERSKNEARMKHGEVSVLPMPRSTRTRTRARLAAMGGQMHLWAADATQYARTRETRDAIKKNHTQGHT